MRTVPAAIVWETICRGRWTLIAGALVANALPLLIENALKMQGGVDAAEPAQIMMHLMLVQVNMFIFGAAVMTAQGNVSRLYAAPIPTATLVTWHMLPAMLLLFLQTALSTMVLNVLFPLNWPIWGPALFGAVSIAAVYAALWQSDKTGWVVVFLTVVAATLGLWIKSRHGPIFGPVESLHYWVTPSLGDVVTLLVMALVAYYAAIQGVARSRRGDLLPPMGIIAWLERIFDPPPEPGPPFLSPAAAHIWYLWRQKAMAMPAIVIFCVVCGTLGWLIFDRNPHNLVMGFVAGGGMLSGLGIAAAVTLGNCGPSDANFDMGNYMGTRPMTTREMSRILLKATMQCMAYAWGIWAAAFAGVAVILLLFGVTAPAEIRWDLLWLYLPATFLGPWIVAGLGISLGLTGRMWIFPGVCFVVFPGMLAYVTLTQMFLTKESQILLGQWLTGIAGILFVLWTVVVYLRARRCALVDSISLYRASFVWVAGSAYVLAMYAWHPTFPISGGIFLIGMVALVVAPFPTVPLALVWNRVR